MASRQSVSKAKSLVAEAAAPKPAPNRLRRHLLVAAALNEVLSHAPIVVGGTAEEYWTNAEYHETDLDLVATLTDQDRSTIRALGFQEEGRHWYHPGARVAVEFPEGTLDGDVSRVEQVKVSLGSARVISLEDLYLDRLRQATAFEDKEGTEFNSALAVAVTRYEGIDWTYIQNHIKNQVTEDPPLGDSMKRLDRKIRQRARRSLSSE